MPRVPPATTAVAPPNPRSMMDGLSFDGRVSGTGARANRRFRALRT
jgi:hypothetical protein